MCELRPTRRLRLVPTRTQTIPSHTNTNKTPPGILVGQILAGVVGPHMGWRAPFVIIALPGVVSGLLTCLYVTEPVRGQSESAVTVGERAQAAAFDCG